MDRRVIAEGDYLRLVRADHWEFVERKNISGIVGMVGVTDEGKLLLVEQYRYPLRKRVIELPAGLVGDTPDFAGEALTEAARRELLEETGYSASSMKFLCEGPPSAGTSAETISIYLAEGLRKEGAGGGDESEDIIVHEVPVSEVHSWLAERRSEGLLVDLRIYTALFFINCNP